MPEKKYLVIRGTARRTQTADEQQRTFPWISLAFTTDWESALDLTHEQLKASGYVTETIDGEPMEIPAELAGLDTEQGSAMREAREYGAVVTVSSEAGDSWADSSE